MAWTKQPTNTIQAGIMRAHARYNLAEIGAFFWALDRWERGEGEDHPSDLWDAADLHKHTPIGPLPINRGPFAPGSDCVLSDDAAGFALWESTYREGKGRE